MQRLCSGRVSGRDAACYRSCMCGRYSITTNVEALRRLFAFLELPNLTPSWNVAPTHSAPGVRLAGGGPRPLAMLRWGLVPFWAKDLKVGASLINARADTTGTKPAFRSAFRERRCLVPADGFYEWKRVDGGKQPYRITMADGDPFAFAGLWESWGSKTEPVETFAIITTEPNALAATVHDRMPVILDPADFDRWLAEPAAELLRPYPAVRMRAYPVS